MRHHTLMGCPRGVGWGVHLHRAKKGGGGEVGEGATKGTAPEIATGWHGKSGNTRLPR